MVSSPPTAAGVDEPDELRDLRSTLHRMLASTAPESVVREHLDSPEGFDRSAWTRLATEIGVQGLAVAEEYGGAGCGMRELAVAGEELGYSLFPGPFLSTVLLGATLIARSRDAATMQALLPGIADGSLVCTLALPQHGAGWDADATTVTAVSEAGTWTLTGTIDHVLDGQVADVILVPARHDGVISVFRVDANSPSVEVRPALSMDQTRRFAHVDLTSASALRIGAPGSARQLLADAGAVGSVGLAADQMGGARRMLEVTADYARTRYQFGRPIGSFQAVKHALANMLISTELARAALDDAVRAVDEKARDMGTAVSVANIVCSEAYYDVAAAAIQLHGGIGFTWEHSAHLYFKRATADRFLLGTPAHHAQRLAGALEL
ncbi:alkylation response protein AidB-like acyl-CoA dehydrogenase [Streptomyces sp. SAI-135]|nr:alkylation response protein AidB-like acyl-CoA dehydrogenase [Streptomyces sp. SAI-090]MDH6573735.1 alkylation response protein AidB-like acyl-CoA dehydrogenase [Streptomyces sp. SAI-117]MDH6613537.1 alkylation response protein AidB-like acyl-CoA dehydrogenase [Streptomyces sp. SAI-135]